MLTDEDIQLLSGELVFCDIEAESTDEFFRKLQMKLEPKGLIKDNWFQAITERENSFATGLQTPTIGVAIPHADGCINEAYIAVVKPVTPVTFQPMGGIGGPVDAELIINLGIVREGGQVEMLQSLMRIFMDEGAVEDIMSTKTPEELVEAIKEHLK